MKYQLRPYQQECVDKAVDFLLDDKKAYNALLVLSTGAGKTHVISAIAKRLQAKILVFCPSKELLMQDYEKGQAYGLDCSLYSASAGKKEIATVTYCTIGSVKNCAELFADFDYFLVDEAHLCNSKHGMFKKFFKALPKKVLGLTATPYRLESHPNIDWQTKKILGKGTSELKMMTKYRGAIFKEIIYNIETGYLVDQGYLSYIEYYDLTPADYDTGKIKKNSSGSDYDEQSLSLFEEQHHTKWRVLDIICRVLNPKDKKDKRNGVLVFVRSIEDAVFYASMSESYAYVSGDMDKKTREQTIGDFKRGKIKVLFNAVLLVAGFDYTALDCVIIATPTMSLSRYTQQVGRAIRIDRHKRSSWVIDLCGNYKRFGRTDMLYLALNGEIWSMQYKKQLTGVTL